MVIYTLRFLAVALILFSIPSGIHGQAFFKILEDPDNFYNQNVKRFENGDILLGDSSLESLRKGGIDGEVYLTRFFECGDINWSFGYHVDNGYLEFRDFVMNTEEEIFVYGSYFVDLQESIFLLKVNGVTGELLDFKLYNPSTVDHFTYSIDIQDDRLMIYGLLLDFNTQKRGFIAFFNFKLNFEEARNFLPFESTGTANFTEEGDIIGRSGPYHFLLTEKGDFRWAVTLDAGEGIQTIGGPHKTSDGYIFEASNKEVNFFYKIRNDGSLEWVSDFFKSVGNRTALSMLNDGRFLGSYSYPMEEATQVSQLILKANGQIESMRKLDLGMSLSTGDIHQSVSAQNTVTIASNVDPFSVITPEIKDFVLQYNDDEQVGDCLNWNSFDEIIPKSLNVKLNNYSFETQTFEMIEEPNVRATMISFSFPLYEFCDETIPAEELYEERSVNCNEDWEVSLPNEDFQWDDIGSNESRLLTEPGVYRARKINCVNPVVVEFKLEKPDCDCNIYLPNILISSAFNGNDNLFISSDCSVASAIISIYDRWGQLVYESNGANSTWAPFKEVEIISSGVFVCVVEYELIDINGNIQEGIAVQDLTLIK